MVHDPLCPAVQLPNECPTLEEYREAQQTVCQCPLITRTRDSQRHMDEAAIGYPSYLRGRKDAATNLDEAYVNPEIHHTDNWGIPVLYRKVAVNIALGRPPFFED